MTKSQIILCFALAAMLSVTSPASGSIFPATLVNGVQNSYEDQSRQSIYDMDGSGTATVGDVFVGFARIDGRSFPTGEPAFPPAGPGGGMYAVFTNEIASITDRATGVAPVYGKPIGTVSSYDIVFGPTGAGPDLVYGTGDDDANSVLGFLDLPTLAPQVGPAIKAGQTRPIAAIYEDVGTDLINFLPAGVTNMLGMVGYIDSFGLDLVVGFGDGAEDSDGLDRWETAIVGVVAGVNDSVQSYAVQNSIPFPSPVGPGFNVGMSAIGGPLEANMLELVSLFGFPGLHEFAFTGEVTGASNLTYTGVGNPFFSTQGGAFPTGQPAVINPNTGLLVEFYGTSDNADIAVFPTPEPGSIAIWGLFAGASLLYLRRRR